MMVLALDSRVNEPDATATLCHHCGEAMLVDATSPAQAPAFCCAGCAGAAQWISDAGLDAYYQLRSGAAGRVLQDAVDTTLWDRDDLLGSHVRDMGGLREVTVLTDDMRCAACAWLVDRALAREPGIVEVCANAITGRIRLRWDPQRVALSQAVQRLSALGYRVFLGTGEVRERARREERNRSLLRLGVAGLGAMQAMMFSEALFLDTAGQMAIPTRDFLRWMTFLVATPVVFYSGWPFLLGAWRELRLRQPGMDSLIAGSTLLAFVASTFETIRGGTHVWFDAAVMFVFLLLGARLLESRARSLANAQVDRLSRAQPTQATREGTDGARERVPVSSLQKDDVVWVVPGEAVPADGVLLDAATSFEEALLTGESQAITRYPGDMVHAGTLCRDRAVRIRACAVGSATRLAQITALVEQAQSHRPALARFADRIASRFVLTLGVCAALTACFWLWHEPSRAFEVTLALLVISCPCALSLAVPVALTMGHGALASCGMLAIRPEALDTLSSITDVVFDKTGTLSDGEPRLGSIETFAGTSVTDALQHAAALERNSLHPLAAAFSAIATVVAAQDVETVAGSGLSGLIAGECWKLGRADFVVAGLRDDGGLWLGREGVARARFEITEASRAGAAASVRRLREAGVEVHLASGDAPAAVSRIAAELSIDDARSRQSPEEKLAMVRALQARGRVVAMVGDGLNDAPVLGGADVSIAVGSGAPLARQAADMVLMHDDLERIADALDIARRTRTIVRQNLGWALGYNALALPIAAAGMVTPWIAAAGMALSSLLVTGNALRLGRGRRWPVFSS